ncbi:hypothetical protein BJY00DRAFT_315337 [Aspergillus carlsbadensis]|nr:hypothetical protein BJY00DRAFT_315337 [Aspergillus carlsbadensis]
MLYQLVLVILTGPLVSGQGPPLPCLGTSLACALQLQLGFLPPLPSRRADCSSYQMVTVTPDTATITTTVATVTTTVTVTGPVLRRGLSPNIEARAVTVTPTALPTYVLRPCTQPGVYGSACACIGIPRTTTTAPTPTPFVSVTATVTTTVTVLPTGCISGSCGSFERFDCDSASGICQCGVDAEGTVIKGFALRSPPAAPLAVSSQCFQMVEGGCVNPYTGAGRVRRAAQLPWPFGAEA